MKVGTAILPCWPLPQIHPSFVDFESAPVSVYSEEILYVTSEIQLHVQHLKCFVIKFLLVQKLYSSCFGFNVNLFLRVHFQTDYLLCN